MTSKPRMSCVILCHNYGRYLDQAIVSCLKQDPGNYTLQEIIVIDDGSSDETQEICLQYEDRIKVIRRSQQGFGPTLTDAFLHSTGDWVAPLDADDWFHPSKLRTCAEAMTGETLFIEHWENVVDHYGNLKLNAPHPGGNTSTLVVRRDAALGLLPVSNEIFFHALREAGWGAALRNPLTYYRIHPDSMTDRITPGVSQDYRAKVCLELADRLHSMRRHPPIWATADQLTDIHRRFRALASRHQVESAVQRRKRLSAIPLTLRMTFETLRARDSLYPWIRSLYSAITGRPLARLTPDEQTEAQYRSFRG